MKKSKKVLIYDPYLDILGGGEKFILSVAKVFDDLGYEIYIPWNNLQIIKGINNRLGLFFSKLKIIPNFLIEKNFINKILLTKKFDYLFYLTDGSYFFSLAKKNYVYCMVPDNKLYQFNLINKIKTWNYLFITHSKFTQKVLQDCGIRSQVLYPYLDQSLVNIEIKSLAKDKFILSVGRFFKHLHSKRQDIMIKSYNKLQQNKKFKEFYLILAGGLKEEDKPYFNYLKTLAATNKSIIFKPNISYKELVDLYKKSAYYWHFSGFGVDDQKNPELVEHMGITPLEAMVTGCITFCYNAGGPKEIIQDGKTGFLFNNDQELIDKMSNIISNDNQQKYIQLKAKKYIEENFSYQVFKKNIRQIINF